MIHFLNRDKVKVRCIECRKENIIQLNHIGTDKEQRSIGYEYEHIYRGDLFCTNCGDKLSLIVEVYEYPKNWITSVEVTNKGCHVIDKFNHDKDILKITNDDDNNDEPNLIFSAKVVTLDSPSGNDEDYIYSDDGFFREIQLFVDGECIAKSGPNHPQSNIFFTHNGKEYLALPNSNDVYTKI